MGIDESAVALAPIPSSEKFVRVGVFQDYTGHRSGDAHDFDRYVGNESERGDRFTADRDDSVRGSFFDGKAKFLDLPFADYIRY